MRYRFRRSAGRVFATAACFLAAAVAHAADGPRQRLLMDTGWTFALSDVPNGQAGDVNDRGEGWRAVELPHDWSIEGGFDQNAPTGGPGGYVRAGVGWYRKHFATPADWAGRRVSVQFDGVYMSADVWVNGKQVGHQPFGYNTFVCDLTPHLNPAGADNVVAVRVDNSTQPNSRWYSGSGIYRHVWMNVTGPVHVADFGTYVTTPKVSAEAAEVRVVATVVNEGAEARAVTVTHELVDQAGKVAGRADAAGPVGPGGGDAGRREFAATIQVQTPALWSVEKPTLYRVRTVVNVGGEVVDTYETPIGIRSIAYDVDKGFLLNGERVKMLGMCLHHDGGAVGAAVPIDVWERRLTTLKQMGCNAIRCSHNPPAPEFLDLCDRLGFLVMDEAFDEWLGRKGQLRGSYASFFNEWSQKDLTAMVVRDRNHPSIVMWSVGNEIGEQRSANGPAILKALVDTCHRLDPTRPVTAACDNAANPNPARPEFMAAMDIAGYNYVDRWGIRRELYFEPDRAKFPERRYVGTEDSGVGGTRGEYGGMIGQGAEARPAYTANMIRAEQLWKFNALHDYVTGYFMWTGIDYLGESRWPRRSATSGVLDQCGFPKDGFYFYQSLWTQAPMVHLLPHWTWKGREGQVIPVVAYTNCDTVELTLNGRSLGVRALAFPREGTVGGWNTYARPDRATPSTADLHATWDVPYEPGTLRAIGRRRGEIVAQEEVKTAGEPAALVATVDRRTVAASTRGVAHVAVRVVDAQGVPVPDAANAVTFELSGPAQLLAVDNGDPAGHDAFQTDHVAAFHGQALALVQAGRAGGGAGRVRVAARAAGLKEAVVEVEVVPGVAVPAVP